MASMRHFLSRHAEEPRCKRVHRELTGQGAALSNLSVVCGSLKSDPEQCAVLLTEW